MAAGVNDKFKKLTNNFSTTLNGAIVGSGDTSMSLSSTTNLPTDTGIVLVVDRVNASGTPTPTLREYIRGTVSGGTVINLVRGIGNSTAQAHLSGAVVEQVVDQTTINDMVDGLLASHDQTGALLPAAVITALGTGNLANTGFNALGQTFSSVVYNGNRSYTCTVSGTDVTNVLSPGMRLRTTRTVAAPTQSTALNGTTQFWSRTAPTGHTFTATWVAGAWIKLSSYANGTIISRFDGSNGWQLQLNASGQVYLSGYSGGVANRRELNSYQSVPLNKWVHIAAQIDMTSSTVSSTINYMMFDGVEVPSAYVGQGTTPTAITQAGSLQVGAGNSTNFFPGKIAQAFVFGAKVTEATIQSYISQGLAGTEPNLVSAYSFNGSANDLNTTNANNLTANGSVTATAADSPFGGQANGTISSTLDYGIVQAATFSTNTTVTVQVPEGCTIPTSGGVSAVVYSSNKVPYGFPGQQDKWRVQTIIRVQTSCGAISTGTFGAITGVQLQAPLGAGVIGYNLSVQQNTSSGNTADLRMGISSSATSYIEDDLNSRISFASGTTVPVYNSTVATSTGINLAASTTYYAVSRNDSGVTATNYINPNGNATAKLFWDNAYL